MITRIYRVEIKPDLRDTFEPLFQTVAYASVADQKGCLRVGIGGPTAETPNEYAMISDWKDADSLTTFAGPDWSVAHIPDGMERFVVTCWVHHFDHMQPK